MSRCVSVTIVLLTAASQCLANVVTVPLDWQARSIEAGFQHLKEHILDKSIRTDTEYVGAVLRTADGSYEFTQGHGKPGQDRVSFRIQRPKEARIVALWHTHGAHGPARSIFSPTDAELVRQTKLPFYLITPDGEVRVLRPEHIGDRRFTFSRLEKGTMARLPRGSHPGERVKGPSQQSRAEKGCLGPTIRRTDVTKV